MSLTGAYHVGTGAAVSLASLLPAEAGTFKQIDIFGNDENAEPFYIGGSDVAADGANAWIAIGPGKAWGRKAGEGSQEFFDLTTTYVIGTASDKLHISYVK